jgi:hypothetical protein
LRKLINELFDYYFKEVVVKRARAEIDEVLGSKNEITYEDLTKLEYVNCVFKESLRKWPPAAEFSRVCPKDTTLNGVFIPKGTWILVREHSSTLLCPLILAYLAVLLTKDVSFCDWKKSEILPSSGEIRT